MKEKINSVLAFMLMVGLTCCQSDKGIVPREEQQVVDAAAEPVKPVTTKIILFRNDTFRMPEAGGYGYFIYVDGSPYIYQPTIPAISGNKGFQTIRDAEKTAKLVAFKIRNNIQPPAITIAELDSMGIVR
jgi:hypothetical protein